jgi:hypothetical protein
MHASRWLAVGQAERSEPEAGALAADRALLRADAKLLVVFCSESHDLPAVLRQINDRSGGVPLIGCSTAGEIATSGPHEASIVVTAFGGNGFSIETAVAPGISADPRAAGAQAASCFAGVEDREHRVLLLLADGLSGGDQQEMLRGVYGLLGAGVPLVGGCAGDDLKMTETFQLYGDQVMTDSVVAAGISSDAPFGIGVRHGWRKVGEPMLVTRSGGNRVFALDGEPALDVYLERLGTRAPARVTPEEFARVALVHPLGLSARDGEPHIRFIAGGDFADRSLSCIAEVPQSGLVWLMEGDAESVLEATDGACDDSLVALEGRPPLGMLAFDCVARRGILGEKGIRVEIDRIAKRATGAPVAGLYTYGEIARTRGLSGFHNQTLVVLSVA